MTNSDSPGYHSCGPIRFTMALIVLMSILCAGTAIADPRYERNGTAYRQHSGDAFGSYKYPRGSNTTPGSGLVYGNRPGEGLNSNRYRDNRRNYPSYRDNRRHNDFNSRRPSSNQGPNAPQYPDNRAGGNSTTPNTYQDRRANSGYRDGYSQGFERGYSKGRRDAQYRGLQNGTRRDNRIYQQNPYYRAPSNFGGNRQRGYGSTYQR